LIPDRDRPLIFGVTRVLFFSGGWEGHVPVDFTEKYAANLRGLGYHCECETTTSCLTRLPLSEFDLIVPNWTMGEWQPEESEALRNAIHGGVGLGGFHGGLGDAFRGDVEFKWMVGGMFVGHPHVGPYSVRITDHTHPITQPLPTEFSYDSEQYYLMMDPGVNVLAETEYTWAGQTVPMPVAWTKTWGRGRVFYGALGHALAEFDAEPAAFELNLRGLRWAAGEDLS